MISAQRLLVLSLLASASACTPSPRAEPSSPRSEAPAPSAAAALRPSAAAPLGPAAKAEPPADTEMVDVCGESVPSTGVPECDGFARSHSVCAPLVMPKEAFAESCRAMIGSMDTFRSVSADPSRRDEIAAACAEARDRLDANCLTEPPPR